MKGRSSLFISWGTFSQPAPSWKPSFEGSSSERSKVALRSLAGRSRGVEQFCIAEVPRGTRLLMTVAGQQRGEWEGEETPPPLGGVDPHECRASGSDPLFRQGRKDWRWRLVPCFGAGGPSCSEGLGLLLLFFPMGRAAVWSGVWSGPGGTPRTCTRPLSCFAIVRVTGPEYPGASGHREGGC